MKALTRLLYAMGINLIISCVLPSCLYGQAVIYVDSSVVSSGTGASWGQAKKTLHEALSAAVSSNTQIWVKKGTYYPTSTPIGCTGCAGPNRSYGFALKNGVGIYGGFAGTETALGQQDPRANPTILSGDINTTGNASDNCYHVVLSSGNDNTAILSGFSITGGNANINTGITLGGHSIVANIGGGLVASYTSCVIDNCSFYNNSASLYGGAIAEDHASLTITGGSFFSNSGGAVYCTSSQSNLFNCCFYANSSPGGGVAAYIVSSPGPVITNCSFVSNSGTNGAVNISGGAGTVITNSIIWGNGAGGINLSGGGSTTVSYSIVQGGYTGTGNLNMDPLFVNSANPAGNDNIMGTADDGLQLRPGSPAINRGSNAAAASMTADIAGAPRMQVGAVDMGAYESAFTGLPLHLLSFVSQRKGGDAILEWKTADEINTAWFNVEKSVDGLRFDSTGRVAAINAAGMHAYRYTDAGALNTTLYYRLKQVDIDGRFTYSPVAQVLFTPDTDPLLFYPNPVSGQATLRAVLLRPEQIQVRVVDNIGKLVQQSSYSIPAGATLLPFNPGGLKPGIYYMKVQGTYFCRQIKIIKQ